MAAKAYVGTSGWNYKHWRNLIYPQGLSQKHWLEFVAEHLDTVEVNTSFYRIPKSESVAAWQASTPEGFVFALKLWRGITHYRKLRNSGVFTANFLKVAQVLEPGRRAPLLIQLPPNQGLDIDRLVDYIRELRSISESRWRIAVEFRNAGWLDKSAYQALDKLNVALCIHDMIGNGDTDQPNDVDFVYVRRHGTSEGRYAGSYSHAQLQQDAERIRNWTGSGKPVFVYYNNDIGGHAFRNAVDLRRLLTG
jgi:uncharacterized protein YecE (DUF72 family)